jgi:hypothetical protein
VRFQEKVNQKKEFSFFPPSLWHEFPKFPKARYESLDAYLGRRAYRRSNVTVQAQNVLTRMYVQVQPRSKNRAAFLYSVLTSAKTQLKRQNESMKNQPASVASSASSNNNGSNGSKVSSPSASPTFSPTSSANNGIPEIGRRFSVSSDEGRDKCKDPSASIPPAVRKAIGVYLSRIANVLLCTMQLEQKSILCLSKLVCVSPTCCTQGDLCVF